MAKTHKLANLDFSYDVDHRNVRYPRLELKTGRLLLVLPKNYSDEESLLRRHHNWLQKKEAAIRNALILSEKVSLESRTESELKHHCLSSVQRIGRRFGFSVNRIHLRQMKSKWGSFSKNKNLTLNTLLRYLPSYLIDYVIFHEVAHSLERRHNERFWRTIERKFPNHNEIENELFSYWFLVQSRLEERT